MLVDTEVEVTLHSNLITHFDNLGYDIPRVKKGNKYSVPRGTKMMVKISDLPHSSTIEVRVECDFCHKIEPKTYDVYNRYRDRSHLPIDTCKDCAWIKIQMTLQDKYGVNSPMQVEEFKDKTIAKLRHNTGDIRKEFIDKDLTPLFEDQDYKNEDSKLKYICNKHPDVIQEVSFNNLNHDRYCKFCGQEKRTGENNWNWKGGVTPFNKYLRQKLSPWMTASRNNCNSKCVITGEDYDVIHHLYAFDKIMQETFKETGIDIRPQMSDYTQEELDMLREKCLEIHWRYPLGVCLTSVVHQLFHTLYGRGETTPEQFEEFRIRYNIGEFKSVG